MHDLSGTPVHSHPPATPHPAASVLLLREGEDGIEVFMVLRSPRLSFSSGALVFPGGKVDPDDHLGTRREVAAPLASGDEAQLALRVAAVRELFEETTVLLARDPRTGDMLEPERAADLESRYRRRVHDGEVSIAEMARAEGIELAIDLLTPFARWITPAHSPRRFDAYFFAAPCPSGQHPEHDGIEAVDSVWLSPREAMKDAEERRRPILFPTRANLSKLGRHARIADALADPHPITPVSTRVVQTANGPILRIPEGLGFAFTEMPADPRHRVPVRP